MALIHLTVRPYVSTFQNTFDGIVLHLIVIISVLPIVEFVDSYDKILIMMIAYLLIILPLASFITIKLLINKNKLKDAIKYYFRNCLKRCSCDYNAIPSNDDDDQEVPINEIETVVDDNMRKNATVVTV